MKNLFTLLVFGLALASHAQQYIPLTGNKGWCVEESYMLASTPMPVQFTGDTVINNVTYFKYFTHFENITSYLRDDTTRRLVYRYDKKSGAEEILYDFNLKKGDTITIRFDTIGPVLLTALTVDSAKLSGNWLSTIRFTHNDTNLINDLIWMEGIGSNWHPDYAQNYRYYQSPGNGHNGFRMICAYKNNQLFYIADTYCNIYSQSNCKGLLSTPSAKKRELTVFPIPFNNYINITGGTISTVEMYDITGREITPAQVYISGDGALLLLDEKIPAGNYILKIETGEGIITRKISRE